MTKKPGNPRRGRRLHGVPKAGDLYVNGQKTPKGNVHAATSRMYRSTDTRRLDGGELARIRIIKIDAAILEAEILDGRCPSCQSLPFHGDHVAHDVDTNMWWHMGVCRTRWVQQHEDRAE